MQSMFGLFDPRYSIGLAYLWFALILSGRVGVMVISISMVLSLVWILLNMGIPPISYKGRW